MVVTQEEYYGRSIEISTGVNLTVDFFRARVWYVNATAGGLQIRMPDATDHKLGGIIGYVALTAASNTVTIADNGGTAITLSDGASTLEADEAAKMLLIANSDADGTWAGQVKDVGATPNPGPAELNYIQGGVLSAEDLIEEYNHQTDTFTAKANSSFDHVRGAAARVGSTIIVWGNNASPDDEVERYTASSNSWATLANFPSAFLDGQGAASGTNTKAYALGYVADRDGTREFDNGTEVWTARTDKTTGCTDGDAVADSNGDMLVANGNKVSVDEQQTFEKFDTSGNSWSGLTNQPAPAVANHGITINNGEVVRLGGFATARTDDTDVYSVSMDSWVTKNDFPENREHQAMGTAETSSLTFGGVITTSSVDTAHSYSFSNDTWTQTGVDMVDDRQQHQSGVTSP